MTPVPTPRGLTCVAVGTGVGAGADAGGAALVDSSGATVALGTGSIVSIGAVAFALGEAVLEVTVTGADDGAGTALLLLRLPRYVPANAARARTPTLRTISAVRLIGCARGGGVEGTATGAGRVDGVCFGGVG